MKLDFLKDYCFFTGVPDSQLKPLCNYLMATYGIGKNHIIAANEGNCAALAAGYHLATGKVPVVYLQNSGIGNIINPVASLLNDKVYGIPCIFIIGWRGEPGIYDEPQHIFQGDVTIKLLEGVDISTFIISKDTTESELITQLEKWRPLLDVGKQVALLVRMDAFEFDGKTEYNNGYTMLREEVIKHVVAVAGRDTIISTTGKASRELFEIREINGQGHQFDFLTVGSMGHSSSIALGIAFQKPDKKIWCIDGDGAALMHMGSMAVLGASKPGNIAHIIINNSAHETVGGMPTVAGQIDFVKIAEGCGYPNAISVFDYENLDDELNKTKTHNELSLIEAKCSLGARNNLGRPTTTARENKEVFMRYLSSLA